MTEDKLRTLLTQPESAWVERKQSLQDDKVLRALVAFANSVPNGAEPAVIFLGASEKGDHPGLDNADEAQKTITSLVTARAYRASEAAAAKDAAPVGGH